VGEKKGWGESNGAWTAGKEKVDEEGANFSSLHEKIGETSEATQEEAGRDRAPASNLLDGTKRLSWGGIAEWVGRGRSRKCFAGGRGILGTRKPSKKNQKHQRTGGKEKLDPLPKW